ncbi:MAG: hypothetical protein QM757_33710 [Paludibaculum sp.]
MSTVAGPEDVSAGSPREVDTIAHPQNVALAFGGQDDADRLD